MPDSEDDKKSSKKNDKVSVLDKIKTGSDGKPLVEEFARRWYKHSSAVGYLRFHNEASSGLATAQDKLLALVKKEVLSVSQIVKAMIGLAVSDVVISTLMSNGGAADMDPAVCCTLLKARSDQIRLDEDKAIASDVKVKLEGDSGHSLAAKQAALSKDEQKTGEEASHKFWEAVGALKKKKEACKKVAHLTQSSAKDIFVLIHAQSAPRFRKVLTSSTVFLNGDGEVETEKESRVRSRAWNDLTKALGDTDRQVRPSI